MKLFCGTDPRDIGIESPNGSWNMAAFREHMDSCHVCKCGAGKIKDYKVEIEPNLEIMETIPYFKYLVQKAKDKNVHMQGV